MRKVCAVCCFPLSGNNIKLPLDKATLVGDVGQRLSAEGVGNDIDDTLLGSRPRKFSTSRKTSISIHPLCFAFLGDLLFPSRSLSQSLFSSYLSRLAVARDGRLISVNYRIGLFDLVPRSSSRSRTLSIDSHSSLSSLVSSYPSSLFSDPVWSSSSRQKDACHSRTRSGTSLVESEVPMEMITVDRATSLIIEEKINVFPSSLVPPTPTLSRDQHHQIWGAALDFEYCDSDSDDELAGSLDYVKIGRAELELEEYGRGETVEPTDENELIELRHSDWVLASPDLWPIFYSTIASSRHPKFSLDSASTGKRSLSTLPTPILLLISSFLEPIPGLLSLGAVSRRLRSFTISSLQPRFKHVALNLGWGVVPVLEKSGVDGGSWEPSGVKAEVATRYSGENGDWLLYLSHLHRLPTEPNATDVEKNIARSTLARRRIIKICQQIRDLIPYIPISAPSSTTILTKLPLPLFRENPVIASPTTLLSEWDSFGFSPSTPPAASSSFDSSQSSTFSLSRAPSTSATSVSQIDLSSLPSPTLSLPESEFVAVTPRSSSPPILRLAVPDVNDCTPNLWRRAKSRNNIPRPSPIYDDSYETEWDKTLPPLPLPQRHERLDDNPSSETHDHSEDAIGKLLPPTPPGHYAKATSLLLSGGSVYAPTPPLLGVRPPRSPSVDSVSGLASGYSEVGTAFSLYSSASPKGLRSRLFRAVNQG